MGCRSSCRQKAQERLQEANDKAVLACGWFGVLVGFGVLCVFTCVLVGFVFGCYTRLLCFGM